MRKEGRWGQERGGGEKKKKKRRKETHIHTPTLQNSVTAILLHCCSNIITDIKTGGKSP